MYLLDSEEGRDEAAGVYVTDAALGAAVDECDQQQDVDRQQHQHADQVDAHAVAARRASVRVRVVPLRDAAHEDDPANQTETLTLTFQFRNYRVVQMARGTFK